MADKIVFSLRIEAELKSDIRSAVMGTKNNNSFRTLWLFTVKRPFVRTKQKPSKTIEMSRLDEIFV